MLYAPCPVSLYPVPCALPTPFLPRGTVFGIQLVEDGPCKYELFWLLILISHCLLPLLTIPFTFWLIPDAKLTDAIIASPDAPQAQEVQPGLNVSYCGERQDVISFPRARPKAQCPQFANYVYLQRGLTWFLRSCTIH